MKRWWLGLACLSASWPFGLGTFGRSNTLVWMVLVAAAIPLLKDSHTIKIDRNLSAVMGLMAIIPLLILPFPYKIVPLLFLLFALLQLALHKQERGESLISALIPVAWILLIQALVMELYQTITARSHELPGLIAKLMAAVARLLGMEAAAFQSNLSLFSMRKVHPVGMTWELILDPMSILMAAAVLAMLLFRGWGGKLANLRGMMKRLGSLLLIMLFWLPLRAGIILALYLHSVLLTEYDKPLNQAGIFWNQWLHLLLLAVPVILCLRFIPWPGEKPKPGKPAAAGRSPWLPAALTLVSVWMITMGVSWFPTGNKMAGRVLVDEYHSQAPWYGKEFDTTRTDKPFNTQWYGQDSTYNYAAIYDYLSYFYQMSRNDKPIRSEMLKEKDILFLKVPSRPFDGEEIEAIHRFVARGGGLLMMGEHTNVFGSGTYLNHVAKALGFRFRYDCLFGMDSVFEQRYRPPAIPHPIVDRVDWLDFAVSCSIEPLGRAGHAAIRSHGLKSLGAQYHVSNYYPQPENSPDMRFGAFIQLWATHFGGGRVVAFTDSTIFANFSAFEPGKAELMTGMIDWLNHKGRSPLPAIFGWLGVVLLGFTLLRVVTVRQHLPLIMIAGILGWSLAALGINSMAPDPPSPLRPVPRAAIDRSISGALLPVGGFISGKEKEFGLLERAILRLGTFPRRTYDSSFTNTRLQVIIYPTRTPSSSYINGLTHFVQQGGNLLVVDGADNAASTADRVLQPFGIQVNHDQIVPKGDLLLKSGAVIEIDKAVTLSGGTPLLQMNHRPVVSQTSFGKGKVLVVGIGQRFADTNMGSSSDVIPSDQLKPVYRLLHSLLGIVLD